MYKVHRIPGARKKERVSRLNPDWVREARDYFLEFLEETGFPHPERLVMFMAALAVKAKAKSYLAIHRLALQYWEIIAEGLGLSPIPETTMRYRLKKISFKPGEAPIFVFQVFPERASSNKVGSADKMMLRARGPVWHQKQKRRGLMPQGLRGVDRDAAWAHFQGCRLDIRSWGFLDCPP